MLELIPPYVATTLLGERQANDPRAMPLGAFITEVMDILKTQPAATEICVEQARALRDAAAGGHDGYEQVFQGLNSAWAEG